MIDSATMAKRLREAGHFCPLDAYTDEAGAAYLLSVTTRTLRNWRDCNVGPPAQRLSRWVYFLDEIESWLRAGANG